MIADLTDASRLEVRRLQLQPRATAPEPLLRALIDRIPDLDSGARPARLELSRPVPSVWADPGRLEQILTNLLSNAVKYSDPSTEIVIRVTPRLAWVEVSVTNVGPEISGEEVERIFSRFYRARGAAARAAGLGIGLYIAKGLVEAHGGRIWVTSRGGRTTFHFTLRRAPAGADVSEAESKDAA